MGISNFQSWLKNNFYRSIIDYNNNPFDHIYIDLNFILHRLFSYIQTKDELMERIVGSITNILASNPPLKTINITADGSASYAKIILQRQRRLESAQKLLSTNEHFDFKTLNSLHFTPGTEFMNSLNEYIKRELKFPNVKINFQLSDEPDEAELKICRLIKENSKSIFDTHLIMSNDADMVLISMAQKDIYNIHILMCHNQGNKYFISIDNLAECYMEKYGYNFDKRLDFILISVLMGDDYFPKLRNSTFDKLWETYHQTILPHQSIVTGTNKINLQLLKKFLSHLSLKMSNNIEKITSDDLYNHNIYQYLFGLQWCVHLYSSGNYLKYDYICPNETFHPQTILLYLDLHKITELEFKEEKCRKIPSSLFSVLVMPYSAQQLVPSKYHHLMDTKLQFSYEEEQCTKCARFRKHVKCTIDNCLDTDNKCLYHMTKFKLHKQQHVIQNQQEYITKMWHICK